MISNRVKTQLIHKFNYIISLENLLEAWREFIRGKKKKRDVQESSLDLMDNIFHSTAILLIIPIITAAIKPLKLMIPSPEIFIRRPCVTGYFITPFTEFCIHFLIKHLSPTHIHAE